MHADLKSLHFSMEGLKEMYPVIIALDPPPGKGWEWAFDIASKLKGKVKAFKVGWPLLLEGNRVEELKEYGPVIADLKLADIGATMIKVVKRVEADAFIAHAFVGYEGALKELREELEGKKLYLVASMSHPGSVHFIDKHWREFLLLAYLVADGLVAPATRTSVLREIRKYWSKEIISPGIGAQGARPCEALRAGADYEIVGRSVTLSEDPAKTLEEMYSCLKG
ncbi:orotidine 5'-phosphate decarboxylase [Ignicoccus pacificus DSM 13166]|uniref:Orotidine 5'-phosphate decarboxylase n=1 Tax=Ignicoccus pacificus DSM 13166 TaxID=940294 RepID=A0A977K973_9CREN|nr:orotidine 5'-phosphate decarboxylase [Ignicoccus pacificus DSM 13166]